MNETGRGSMVTPNMISVCVDGAEYGEIRGRMYCCYEKKGISFANEHKLIRYMEHFMDLLNYPQSSVNLRSYHSEARGNMQHQLEPHSPETKDVNALLGHSGKLATLLVYVKYRQNATWQGTVVHRDTGRREDFRSELEFLRVIDRAIDGTTGGEPEIAWAD